MRLTYENQGTNTYLVYEVQSEDALDSMSLGMLTNNSIPGFAAVSFTQMDMTKYIKYNVSAEVSVKQLFTGPVNKKRLLGVFSGVVDAMLSAEEYMLDPGTILLDTDYIFADVSTCQAELVCLPIMNLQQQNPDLATFFKNILFTTQFDQTENCDHVAQLINYLNTNPVLVLEDFKELLHTLTHGAAPAAPVAPVQQPVQPVAPVPQPVQPVVQAPVQPVQPAQIPVQPPVQPVQKKAPVAPAVPPVQGMQIPGAASAPNKIPVAPAPNNAPAAPQGTPDGKPMTLMYLMQHYTKENAAIYKAQQEAAKKKKNAPAPAQPMAAPMPGKPVAPPMPGKPVAPPMPGKAAPAKPQPGPGFAIPGQPAPGGFAIPGQPTPPPAPTPAVPKMAPNPVAPKPAPAPVPPVAPAPQPVQQPVYQPPIQSAPLNFGETTVLSAAMGETTVLSSAVETKQNDPHLIRVKNNEKIPLNKPVFRIGKEKSYVDYFISDNTAISRSHANIIDHNGEFFVVDTNSTNHTYVNGGMIQSGVETKLSHGTKLRFANEEFEFKMY